MTKCVICNQTTNVSRSYKGKNPKCKSCLNTNILREQRNSPSSTSSSPINRIEILSPTPVNASTSLPILKSCPACGGSGYWCPGCGSLYKVKGLVKCGWPKDNAESIVRSCFAGCGDLIDCEGCKGTGRYNHWLYSEYYKDHTASCIRDMKAYINKDGVPKFLPYCVKNYWNRLSDYPDLTQLICEILSHIDYNTVNCWDMIFLLKNNLHNHDTKVANIQTVLLTCKTSEIYQELFTYIPKGERTMKDWCKVRLLPSGIYKFN